MSNYRDLTVWFKSVNFVVSLYKLTEKFPNEEKYGLAMQMKRAAISIPSNIAEGSRRGTKRDFRRFLLNAFASGAELETQIEIARKLPFGKDLNYSEAEQLLNEIMRMLNRMITHLNK